MASPSDSAPGSGHHANDAATARCLVLVASDTRTLQSDEAGALVAERLTTAGYDVAAREIVSDDRHAIRIRVLRAVEDEQVELIIIAGGTGLTRRDVTPEAVGPLLNRTLPGFGEAFRRLSQEEIGIDGLMSRAFAGVAAGSVIFALPGSKGGCRTAMDALILPMLPHLLGLCRT